MKHRTSHPITAVALAAVMPLCQLAAQEEAAEGKSSEPMIEAPADVSAPPEAAQKTDSGLASRVLKEGEGKVRPTASDTVTVHYSGWTTDGKLFDSSRGQPSSFGLSQVIKGWTEGLQLMVKGEKRRFWIPADLAYGENPGDGRPGGMLVFDVELLDIKEAPKPPGDAAKTEGGVAYKILEEGEGETPGDDQVVTFHFVGQTMEGEAVQDTRAQDQPISVGLDTQGLPKELVEVLSAMKPGEKRRAWIPEARIPGGILVADLELLSFKDAPPPPETPADVAAVPDDAKKTDSGLASKVLEPGKGDQKPKPTDTVKVHYSGWTTDGELFDSSVARGEPTTFPLNRVIAGWTEGLQLMVEGEKRRFWIPADLAYGENPQGGAPSGMLVFDVELLEIVR